MSSSLQSVFRDHFPRYAQGRELHAREWRAASAIMNCHSAALGGHVLTCSAGHYSHVQYNACRHRSCPQCADRPRQAWVQAQLQHLLPCEHFHAVFTLPHEFIALWEFNRTKLNALLFDCARLSLLELCSDERYLGATPGIIMALHTWGRTLSLHPHVHCLVSAGGLDARNEWRASRAGYLVPVKALASLFRGKLLHHLKRALTEHRLQLPPQQDAQHWLGCIRQQYRKHWNVELAQRYPHGRGVALYLARYVKGGPLSHQRTLHSDEHTVRFGYTDHRDAQRKNMTLAAAEFITRVLAHAPPRGQHMVRHCGLYSTAAKVQHQRATQLLRPTPMPTPEQALARHHHLEPAPKPRCPKCHGALERTLSVLPVHRLGEISIDPYRRAATPPGPTGRSSGQTTAGDVSPLRRRFSRRCLPLN